MKFKPTSTSNRESYHIGGDHGDDVCDGYVMLIAMVMVAVIVMVMMASQMIPMVYNHMVSDGAAYGDGGGDGHGDSDDNQTSYDLSQPALYCIVSPTLTFSSTCQT